MTLEDDLTTAAATGNAADVESLLQAGAKVNGVNCFGRSALQADASQKADFVSQLAARTNTTLLPSHVMMMGSTPVALLLLKHGADPNAADRSTGTTPLHDAARTGFVDTVRLLVEFGADPQARDDADFRPVDLARDKGNTDVVAFLESL